MSIELSALDGANPLAFLASIGMMSLLRDGECPPKLRWVRRGIWCPEIVGPEDPEALCSLLAARAKAQTPVQDFQILGKNITVTPDCFRTFVEPAYQRAIDAERGLADFAAAFGSEILEDDKGRIEYTRFCFITGSGHQDFLMTMKKLAEAVTDEHIKDALFGSWTRLKGLSMRWDPSDAAEYAFRWSDPSSEGASAVWGANLLAAHALPLLPTHPTTRGLVTTGFREASPYPQFTWPIWTDPVTIDTIRSLLSLPDLHVADDNVVHEHIRARGIAQIFRSPRVRIGQGANFKVSFRPARGI